ncbi:MAG TPA: hypothetical protein VJ802_18085 [Gemmatimonadaceae bacterium]|nr:hypothetical protein [Gemmatimonadaceae bacterium]
MPDELRDPGTIGTGFRHRDELQRIVASLRALEQRRDLVRSAADREKIEARMEQLGARADALAKLAPSLEELLDARVRLADATNNDALGGVIDASFPVLLLPIRLQTRFAPVAGGVELRIRFLPDSVAIHTHEPELTPDEQALGADYWRAHAAAADDAGRLAAWSVLVGEALGAERAAWIAVSTNPAGGVADELLDRLIAWTRAAATDVLPERFTVRGYADGSLVFERTTGRLVPPSLTVGFDPNEPGDDQADAQTIDELVDGLPQQLQWLTNFAVAEDRGMALRVPLTSAQAARGFDRIVVLGVRTAADAAEGSRLVRDLLDAHHYTEGLAIAPRGAPTNNTEESGAWYSSSPPMAQTFVTERQAPLFDPADDAHHSMDGPQLAGALGIAPETFEHVRGANGTDQREAAHMACALWPATWGYYLKQILADTISAETIAGLRRHFIAYVRGRGPLPPLRAGPNPYGVLPVASLDAWTPRKGDEDVPQPLPGILRRMSQDWLTMSGDTPRVGRTGDPSRDLYELMTMQANSSSYAASAAYGEEFTGQTSEFINLWGIDWGEVFPFLEQPADEMTKLLRRLGLDEDLRPRLTTFAMDAPAPVEELSLVHAQVGPQPLPGQPNYIAWLATAPVEDIRSETGRPAGSGNTMLYRILRHSVLSAYVETAKTIQIDAGMIAASARFEPELVAMPGVETPSPYSYLNGQFVPPGGQQQVRIGDYLSYADVGATAHLREVPRWLEEFVELRECLLRLATVPTERLQLLMTETLDCCSHRLDAWITSLATRRLRSMRSARATGVYVGAYGWVEDLRRAQAPAGGGYVLAPSSSHATAAAILRSGYLSRDGPARGTLAVELSSHRVKQALWLFESVRMGNTLAAVLGYRFERSLHEAPLALGLEQYLPAFRDAFPIDEGILTEPNGPTEAIAASAVVNGLELRKQWLTFGPTARGDASRRLFDNDDLPLMGSNAGRTLIDLLDQLEALHDTMADIALAEGVFQTGTGHFERAGAVAAAMAGERQMPEIEIARTPRTGTTIRNRVILSLDPVPANTLNGWPNARTPRATAAPELNQWLAAAIGDPADIRVQVRYLQGNPPVVTREWVQLGALGVDAIDMITFAASGDTARASELEERIRYLLAGANATRRAIDISFDHPPPWAGAPARPPGIRTLSEVSALLQALQNVAGASRAATPADLNAPDRAGDNPLVGLDVARLTARARGALTALWNAYRALQPLIADARQDEADRLERNATAAANGNPPAAGDETPDPAVLDAIRSASFALGWHGVNDAVIPHEPPAPAGDLVAARVRWYRVVDRAEGALREAAKRLIAILEVDGPAAITQAEVDTELAALTQRATDANDALAAVDTAINGGASEAVIEGAERTRDLAIGAVLSRCTEVLKLAFGKAFVVTPPFVLGTQHALSASHTTASPNALVGASDDAMAHWLFQVSQAHPTLTELELATTMSVVQTARGSFSLSAAQTPFANGDRWAALDRQAPFPPGLLSVVFMGLVRFSDANNDRFAGLVVADWEEVVPHASETAALTFQFDQPGSEPPQVMLLAVPAGMGEIRGQGPRWSRSQLFDIIEDTRRLARIRTVDPPLMQWYGVALPALYFTQNFAQEAISTYFYVEPQVMDAVAVVARAPNAEGVN